jgi:hypothetical protein
MTRAGIQRHGPYDARLPPITKAAALRAEQAHLCLTASAIYPASDRAESAIWRHATSEGELRTVTGAGLRPARK